MRIIITILTVMFASATFGQDTGVRSESLKANTGIPGPATVVRFRCSSSVDSTNQPLLVVDGEVKEYNYLKTLDPNQIESISILKDSSSTQLFCTRNPRGVIVITLKCDKKNIPAI